MYDDQADLVISTSHIESMPRTTMEAFLVGAPTILTDLPVYRSLGLRHREHAWLYPPGDVERLAEGIAFLLDHPDERKRMARAGQRWARALLPGPAEVARAWSALFKEVGRG
jgi:glycosyltransferase involved in cell wall biosynthesis